MPMTGWSTNCWHYWLQCLCVCLGFQKDKENLYKDNHKKEGTNLRRDNKYIYRVSSGINVLSTHFKRFIGLPLAGFFHVKKLKSVLKKKQFLTWSTQTHHNLLTQPTKTLMSEKVPQDLYSIKHLKIDSNPYNIRVRPRLEDTSKNKTGYIDCRCHIFGHPRE